MYVGRFLQNNINKDAESGRYSTLALCYVRSIIYRIVAKGDTSATVRPGISY
jgi:hypothetical protein